MLSGVYRDWLSCTRNAVNNAIEAGTDNAEKELSKELSKEYGPLIASLLLDTYYQNYSIRALTLAAMDDLRKNSPVEAFEKLQRIESRYYLMAHKARHVRLVLWAYKEIAAQR